MNRLNIINEAEKRNIMELALGTKESSIRISFYII